MNTKVSVFVICVEVIIYLLLYNFRDSTFNLHLIFFIFYFHAKYQFWVRFS